MILKKGFHLQLQISAQSLSIFGLQLGALAHFVGQVKFVQLWKNKMQGK